MRPELFPEPANVDTTPLGVTFLILWLKVSATKTFPELSTASPFGAEKLTDVPVPSVLPEDPPPAKVVTTPPELTFLIL